MTLCGIPHPVKFYEQWHTAPARWVKSTQSLRSTSRGAPSRGNAHDGPITLQENLLTVNRPNLCARGTGFPPLHYQSAQTKRLSNCKMSILPCQKIIGITRFCMTLKFITGFSCDEIKEYFASGFCFKEAFRKNLVFLHQGLVTSVVQVLLSPLYSSNTTKLLLWMLTTSINSLCHTGVLRVTSYFWWSEDNSFWIKGSGVVAHLVIKLCRMYGDMSQSSEPLVNIVLLISSSR